MTPKQSEIFDLFCGMSVSEQVRFVALIDEMQDRMLNPPPEPLKKANYTPPRFM